MKTWKDRLDKETKKLYKKIEELESFIDGSHGNFADLPEPDRDLLLAQHACMATYVNILDMRRKRLGLLECATCKKKKDEMINILNKVLGDKEVNSGREDVRTFGPFNSIEEAKNALKDIEIQIDEVKDDGSKK